MSFSRQITAGPGQVAKALDSAEEEPSRQEERELLDVASDAAKKLVPKISAREKVMITIQVHSDPAAEGFNARHASVTVSRVDPDADAPPAAA